MTTPANPRGMTRRELLKRGTALSAAFVAGTGFLAHATDAWAVELKALSPATMASLIQMARDIYPHDRIADRFYAIAVKGHDDKAAEDAVHKALIEDGIADLDARAQAAGAPSISAPAGRSTGWRCCARSSPAASSRRSAAGWWSASTTRKRSGRSSATRASRSPRAAISIAVSTTSRGCKGRTEQ